MPTQNTETLLDEAAVRRFVELLHTRAAAATAGMVLQNPVMNLCVLDAGGKMRTSRYSLGDAARMAADAITSAQGGRNVSAEGRLVRGDGAKRGTIEHTLCTFALVAERDGDTGKFGRALNGATHPLIVETSPGNQHDWHFLDRALPPGEAQPLGVALRKAIGADHSTGSTSHCYRIPGCPNFPNGKKLARGRVTCPTRIVDEGGVITRAGLEAALPPPELPRPRVKPAPKPRGKSKLTLRVAAKVARKASADMDRSAEFQSIVQAAVRDGVSMDALEKELRARPGGCASKYLENGDRLHAEIERSWLKAEAQLAENEEPEKAKPPPCTLADVHDVFGKWLGSEYDLDTIDAVVAAAASERLTGDPLWLLVVSGPGNAKTETVQALAGCGGHVTSTIASEGALLSATPGREHAKRATGGLLRKIGKSGLLIIKDVTSILSASRDARGTVLAALREIYDGRWERNVGTDGGQTLTWEGRLVIVGAVTTVWDTAHAVVAAMGDRFVLIRSNSGAGRLEAGKRAINNTGGEAAMRQELAGAVGGLVAHVDPGSGIKVTDDEVEQILAAADIVTYARTAVERDYQGNVLNSHAPEMPTRLAKQLTQLIRGAVAIGMEREAAMRLAIRCARDSIPPLRLEILLDLAAHPSSRPTDVRRRLSRPWSTIRREMEALHMLTLLQCDEETTGDADEKTIWRYQLAPSFDRATLLAMAGPRHQQEHDGGCNVRRKPIGFTRIGRVSKGA